MCGNRRRGDAPGRSRGAGRFLLPDERDADDLAVEDHVGADEALALEDGVPAVQPVGLADEHEPIAGADTPGP